MGLISIAQGIGTNVLCKRNGPVLHRTGNGDRCTLQKEWTCFTSQWEWGQMYFAKEMDLFYITQDTKHFFFSNKEKGLEETDFYHKK